MGDLRPRRAPGRRADAGGARRRGRAVHPRRARGRRRDGARDRLDHPLPARARRRRGDDREARGRDDADRVAHRHRGRLQPERRHRGVRRGERRRRARRPAGCDPAHDVRARRRGAGAAARARRSRRSRSCHATTCRATAASRALAFTTFARLRDPELGEWVDARGRVPQLDGGPHHARDHRRRSPRRARALRHRGSLARGVRAVHPVGARGRVPPPGGRATRRSACRSSPTSSRTS